MPLCDLSNAYDNIRSFRNCQQYFTILKARGVRGCSLTFKNPCRSEMLLRAAQRAGVSHFAYVSIVGVDRNLRYFYYRVKRGTEKVVEQAPVPWTILRAT